MVRKILHILYQPYKWLVYIPLMGLSTMFFVFLGIIIIFIFNDTAANRTTGVWWAKFNSYMVPMFVKIFGRDNMIPLQSYVIVANHQSHFDIFLLYGWLGIDIKWVIKQELRKVPVFGLAAEKGGNILIDRSDSRKAYESLKKAGEKVVDGTSIVILPEGTRSKTGKIGIFKKGAFQMAMDLGLPVLPVTIANTRHILRPGTMDLFPGRVIMKIHSPVDSSQYSAETIEKFRDHVQDVIQAGLDELKREDGQ